jgi:hypothetical protein
MPLIWDLRLAYSGESECGIEREVKKEKSGIVEDDSGGRSIEENKML